MIFFSVSYGKHVPGGRFEFSTWKIHRNQRKIWRRKIPIVPFCLTGSLIIPPGTALLNFILVLVWSDRDATSCRWSGQSMIIYQESPLKGLSPRGPHIIEIDEDALPTNISAVLDNSKEVWTNSCILPSFPLISPYFHGYSRLLYPDPCFIRTKIPRPAGSLYHNGPFCNTTISSPNSLLKTEIFLIQKNLLMGMCDDELKLAMNLVVEVGDEERIYS